MTRATCTVFSDIKNVIFLKFACIAFKIIAIINLIMWFFFWYTHPFYAEWRGAIWIGFISQLSIPIFFRIYSVLFNWITENQYRNQGKGKKFKLFRFYSYIFCFCFIIFFEFFLFAFYLPLSELVKAWFISLSGGGITMICIPLLVELLKKLL